MSSFRRVTQAVAVRTPVSAENEQEAVQPGVFPPTLLSRRQQSVIQRPIILRQLFKTPARRTTLLRYCQPYPELTRARLAFPLVLSPRVTNGLPLEVRDGIGPPQARCPTPRTKPSARSLHNSALVPDLGDGAAVEARARWDYRARVPTQIGRKRCSRDRSSR